MNIISTGVSYPYGACPSCLKLGETIDRAFYQFGINYGNKLYEKRRNSIWLTLGISYRNGYEYDFLSFPRWWEIKFYNNNLSDFGLNGGLKYQYQISQFLSISAYSNLNYFFINSTTPEIAKRTHPLLSGPTRSFSYFGVGLEFNLSKRE